MILLSIAIPTRNRQELLKQLIDSVLVQMTEEIEIVVTDNVSSDTTPEYMGNLISSHPNLAIRFVRNSENIGAERNLNAAVLNSTGKFVWLMGDDDIVLPGSIQYLLNILKSGNYVNGVINYDEYDYDMRVCECRSRLKLKTDLLDANIADVLRITSFWFSFFSCHVIRRDLWNAADRSMFESGPRTDSIQLYLPIIIGNQGKNFVTAKVLLAKRASKYELSEIFSADIVRGWYLALKRAESLGVDKSVTRLFFNEYISGLHLTRDILIKRINRYRKFNADILVLISQYWTYPKFWIYVAPLFVTPRFAAVGMRNLYKTLKVLVK